MANQTRINSSPPADWRDLQQQVARILAECGLTAEVERAIETARGQVKVDVFAIDPKSTPPAIYLAECKHWKDAVPKEKVHAFRTVMEDYGANCGFLISSSGFQSGAYEAARFSSVRLLTWEEFEDIWQSRWVDVYLRPRLYKAHEPLCDYVEPLLGSAMVRKVDALPEEKRRRFIELRGEASRFFAQAVAMHFGAPWHHLFSGTAIDLPLAKNPPDWAPHAPQKLITTDSLRNFGDILLDWIAREMEEFDALFAAE